MTRNRRTSLGRSHDGAFQLSAVSAMMNVGALRQIVRPLRPLLPPRVVLFAVLFAWFLYAAVDLRLVFLDRDVLFLWNLRYLTDFVGQPGSLLQWSDNLLVQMCYFGWPAAIAIAAVTWLLLVSTVGLMNALGHAKMRGGWLIPAILVATLFGGYEFPTPTIVGLAVAVTAANGWVKDARAGLGCVWFSLLRPRPWCTMLRARPIIVLRQSVSSTKR